MTAVNHHRTSVQTRNEHEQQERTLTDEITTAHARMAEISKELSAVMDQLGEAKVDKHESARAAKKAELIENLKRLYPGVVSGNLELILNKKCF